MTEDPGGWVRRLGPIIPAGWGNRRIIDAGPNTRAVADVTLASPLCNRGRGMARDRLVPAPLRLGQLLFEVPDRLSAAGRRTLLPSGLPPANHLKGGLECVARSCPPPSLAGWSLTAPVRLSPPTRRRARPIRRRPSPPRRPRLMRTCRS